MAGTGGDGRVCKSLTPGAPGRTTKTAIGGQRVRTLVDCGSEGG